MKTHVMTKANTANPPKSPANNPAVDLGTTSALPFRTQLVSSSNALSTTLPL